MKRYERESFIKNFLVFFSLLEILLLLLFLELSHTQHSEYRQNLYKTMQVCSYTMECPQFIFDFSPKEKTTHNELFIDKEVYAHFPIPSSEKFNLKIAYPLIQYQSDINTIQWHLYIQFFLATLVLLLLALVFTFYSLRPIRKALQINDEFIKDILHDFNTPITSIILNIQMAKEDMKHNPFMQKISHSIDTILLLQNNLKSFLHHSPTYNENVNISSLCEKRLCFIENIYPKIHFTYISHQSVEKITNEELLTRILDNLLSNAAKYNKPSGKVTLTVSSNAIIIQDTGKGIKNIDKVLQRYYKEQERGLGLGLSIVKKLTLELGIILSIASKVNVGTTITLDLSNLKEEQI